MIRARTPFLRTLAILALTMPLAGCISFGAKPPPSLMSLSAASPIAAGPARASDDAQAIAVAIPSVQPALGTQRVMVQAGPNAVAYLKNAQWVAPPAMLFRNLLAETITARTGRIVPDQRLTAAQPDTRLSGQIVDFGLDGPGMAVVVTFDGTIAHSGSTRLLTRRFTARVPVASEDGPAVSTALNQAANQVAGDVASWVGGG